MDLELKDRVIVITGASRGIGAATARLLAGEGARLVLVSRNAEALADVRTTLPAESEIVACDMNDADSAALIVDEARSRFGRIDGLVNCAGATAGGADWDARAAGGDGRRDPPRPMSRPPSA